MSAPALVVTAAAAFALAAAALWAGPRRLVPVAVVALVLSRFRADVAEVSLRLDQLASLGLLVWSLSAGRRPARVASERVRRASLAGYLAVGVASVVVVHGSAGQALRSAAVAGAAVAAYWAAAGLTGRGFTLERLTGLVVASAAWLGAAAFVLWVVSYAVGPVPGVQVDPADAGRHLAYVSMYEANLLGAYLAAALVLASNVGRPARSARSHALVVQGAIAAGLLATLTRGAWVACVAGLAAAALAGNWQRHAGRAGRAVAVALAVGGLALGLSGTARDVLAERVTTIADFSTGSAQGRLRITGLALEGWRRSPVVGNGLMTFDERLPGAPPDSEPWIPSLAVAALHDTGIVGSALLGAFFGSLAVGLWRSRRRNPVAPAWLGAVVTLFVASQATQAQILPLFWFLLGLAAVAASDAPARTRSPAPSVPARAGSVR